MRLCGGCQSKMDESIKGLCSKCKAERGVPTSDGIRSNVVTSYNGSYDALLDSLRKGGRWQRVRLAAVKRCPMCARCDVALSEIVDHIVPAYEAIRQAQASGNYPFDKYAGYYIPSNLQGLCRPCHGAKTVEDKRHVGAWPDVIAKQQAQPRKVWSF
jgi:5-methylcytosine-specific restriction endonuclease McrA